MWMDLVCLFVLFAFVLSVELPSISLANIGSTVLKDEDAMAADNNDGGDFTNEVDLTSINDNNANEVELQSTSNNSNGVLPKPADTPANVAVGTPVTEERLTVTANLVDALLSFLARPTAYATNNTQFCVDTVDRMYESSAGGARTYTVYGRKTTQSKGRCMDNAVAVTYRFRRFALDILIDNTTKALKRLLVIRPEADTSELQGLLEDDNAYLPSFTPRVCYTSVADDYMQGTGKKRMIFFDGCVVDRIPTAGKCPADACPTPSQLVAIIVPGMGTKTNPRQNEASYSSEDYDRIKTIGKYTRPG